MHASQTEGEPVAFIVSPPPDQSTKVSFLHHSVYDVVGFAEVSHHTVLVGPPGYGRLDEGNQGVGPLGETVVKGQTGVVVVQAAVGHYTELSSSRAGLQDTRV